MGREKGEVDLFPLSILDLFSGPQTINPGCTGLAPGIKVRLFHHTLPVSDGVRLIFLSLRF
jgi:hypothetical protein